MQPLLPVAIPGHVLTALFEGAASAQVDSKILFDQNSIDKSFHVILQGYFYIIFVILQG